ncbi:MAG: ABC transporter permease subunit [Ignavibacteria bacterium]|nr:ABC transporter permease subunit [Ignavibacteria bacterium]
MLQYFIRRILLAVPTFIGCTIIVFFIVQLAPGGPLEQQIQQLKQAAQSGERGGAREGTDAIIPPQAMAELQRYYQFDKPIWQRYLIWLGVYPRPMDKFDVPVVLGKPRKAGAGLQIIVNKEDGQYVVRDASDKSKILDDWNVEYQKVDSVNYILRAYKTEYAGILTGYFGISNRYQEPVMKLVMERLPISMQFGIISVILTYLICVYLGIQKALNHGSRFDVISSAIVFMGYSVPGWALGAVLLVIFSTQSGLDLLPLRGFQSTDYDQLEIGSKILDRAYHFILPTIAYTTAGFASLTMLMKNSLLENMSQDYVRTAFAKGLNEKRVIWVHAMRNSIIPIASRLGFLISVFLASSYLIEIVFSIEGLGKLSFSAILQRDYPIVFSFTVINVAIILIGTLLSDFILAMVDPRIKFK